MTAPLLATRDALARALFATDFPDPGQAETIWAGLADDLLPKLTYFRKADALLASGVVRDAATLADDEALMRRWHALSNPGEPIVPDWDWQRAAIKMRALAAALTANHPNYHEEWRP